MRPASTSGSVSVSVRVGLNKYAGCARGPQAQVEACVSVRVGLSEYAVVHEAQEHAWKRECECTGRSK